MSLLKKQLMRVEEDIEYTPILEKASDEAESGSISDNGFAETIILRPSKNLTVRRVLSSTVKAVITALAITGAALLIQGLLARLAMIREGRFVASLSPSCSCGGTTVAEAKRRGCVLSPLAIAWLPPHCIDQELSDQFDKAGPGPNGEWDYWSDLNGTHRMTLEEMGYLGETDGLFYTTQEWHVMHCIYTWQKHYRSRWTGVTVERRSNGLDHIAHCAMIVRLQFGLQDIATVSGIALDADDPGDDGLNGPGSKGDKFELSY